MKPLTSCASKGHRVLGTGLLIFILMFALFAQAHAQPSWTQLSPTGALPGIRGGAAATYDPATNAMTVFGGTHGTNGAQLNDVWVLKHANGLGGTPSWTQL